MKALYVSYDGALDPLGASQIVPYLRGLGGRGVGLTLLTFEKGARRRNASARREIAITLESGGVGWRPLAYHKCPRVPATAWDVLRGSRAIRGEARRVGATLIHCRGDVAMAMARLARLPGAVRLLYDVRGHFADERVAGGSWKAGSLLDRLVRRFEAANLARADALVVLTTRALDILARRRAPLPPHAVIPTCVALDAFTPRASGENADYVLAYVGSLGARYRARDMAALGRAAVARWGGRVLFLTPDVLEAERAGITADWADVRFAPPPEVSGWIRRARATMFLITPGPAACPTKFAESLACGLPVLANRGIGDLDEIVTGERVGALIDSLDAPGYARALDALDVLLAEPDLAARCRRVAEQRYSVASAVDAYHRLYVESGGEPA